VSKFKYFGTIVTNQYCIHEEIESKLYLRNAFCHSDQRLLSFLLLYKSLKIKIYKTIILPDNLRVFENRVLRTIFRPKKEEVAGGWRRRPHSEELHSLYKFKIFTKYFQRIRWAGYVTRVGWVRNSYIFLSENLKERGHGEDLRVGARKCFVKVWTGCESG
jgi:hypothetical protein